MSNINKIIIGYGNLIKSFSKNITSFLKIILFLISVFALSILIVYPLWLAATKSPQGYTFSVILTSILLFIIFLVYKFITKIKEYGFKTTFRKFLIPKLKKLTIIIFDTLIILVTIFLYSFSIPLGLICTIIVMFILGYIKFVFKS